MENDYQEAIINKLLREWKVYPETKKTKKEIKMKSFFGLLSRFKDENNPILEGVMPLINKKS